MFRLKLLFLIWLMVACILPIICQTQSQSTTIQNKIKIAESLFGTEVQGQQHLFELNQDYALRIRFDRNGDVSSVMVFPKYYLEESNPEWKEPDHVVGFSSREYEEMLSKVSKLNCLGSLVTKGTVGVVTNSKLWLLDQYQQAFVRRSLNRTVPESNSSSNAVHSFSIYFIRGIDGIIEDKQATEQFGSGKQLRLKIGGCWYLTTSVEFDKAEKGRKSLLYVAGPIDETQEDCP